LLPPTDTLLSTQSLAGIVDYAPEDLYVTVGAGTRLEQLQAELSKDAMWVPLISPWREATVGGIVASNFNAPLRMRYGSVRDLVLAVTAILPDGRIIRAGRPVVKNVAGYDLTKLFVGSYGTLGLIGAVTFKVTPLPRAVATLVAPIENLDQGLRSGSRLLRSCLVGSAILLCRGCNLADITAPYVLVYTVEGLKEDVAVELAQARDALRAEGAVGVSERTFSGSEMWATWLSSASPSQTTLRAGVAPKDLARVLKGVAQELDNTAFIADIASGQLFVRGMVDVESVRQSARGVGGYAVVLGGKDAAGNVSTNDVWGYAPDALDLMRALKARWDARGLLNPGAFLV
jgi:D-lactate dehydrogenase (cytochrome)